MPERVCEGFCILVVRKMDVNIRSLSFNFFGLSPERCQRELSAFSAMFYTLHRSQKFQVRYVCVHA